MKGRKSVMDEKLCQVHVHGFLEMNRLLFDFQILEYRALLTLFCAGFKGPLTIPHPELNRKC